MPQQMRLCMSLFHSTSTSLTLELSFYPEHCISISTYDSQSISQTIFLTPDLFVTAP